MQVSISKPLAIATVIGFALYAVLLLSGHTTAGEAISNFFLGWYSGMSMCKLIIN